VNTDVKDYAKARATGMPPIKKVGTNNADKRKPGYTHVVSYNPMSTRQSGILKDIHDKFEKSAIVALQGTREKRDKGCNTI